MKCRLYKRVRGALGSCRNWGYGKLALFNHWDQKRRQALGRAHVCASAASWWAKAVSSGHRTQALTTSIVTTQNLHITGHIIMDRKGDHETLSLPKGLLIADSCWRRKTRLAQWSSRLLRSQSIGKVPPQLWQETLAKLSGSHTRQR